MAGLSGSARRARCDGPAYVRGRVRRSGYIRRGTPGKNSSATKRGFEPHRGLGQEPTPEVRLCPPVGQAQGGKLISRKTLKRRHEPATTFSLEEATKK